MKNSAKIALMGATAAAIALTVAMPLAAKGKMRMGAHFEQIDTNADGFIDEAEIIAARDARFAEMDANGDGAIDAEEMEAHHAKRMEERKAKSKDRAEKRKKRMMARLDTNEDGLLQKEEMNAHGIERMMKHLDADGDGRISKEEAEAKRGKRRKASE